MKIFVTKIHTNSNLITSNKNNIKIASPYITVCEIASPKNI